MTDTPTPAPDFSDFGPPIVIERRRPRSWLEAPRRTVLIYVLLFIAAELLGAYVSIVGQACAEAVLAFVAVNQAVFGHRTQRTTGIVMAGLFTTRLMVLSIPAVDIALSTRTAIVGLASCLIAYLATWVISQDVQSGRSAEGFSLKKPFVSKGFTEFITVLSALPIGYGAFEILKPNPQLFDSLLSSAALPVVLAAVGFSIGALGEELIFRRLTAAMVQHAGQSQTPWISACLFAAAYLGTQNLAFVALMFFVGAFFAWSCERTGSIRSVVAAHALASMLVFLALP